MNTDITKYFGSNGLSLNGRVQLEQDEAHNNSSPEPAYEQLTTISVKEVDGVDVICESDDEDSYRDIYLTTSWEISNPDAEEEEDACDWDEWTVTTDGGEISDLLTK